MPEPGNAIEFRSVSKTFRKGESAMALRDAIPGIFRKLLGREPRPQKDSLFYALRDVSLCVKKGETLGIIGPNGAGKTTILKLIAGILKPKSGVIEKVEPVGVLIELGAGFHADLTGRENIYLYGSILGLSKKEIHKKFDAIAGFAEIGDFMEMPLKRYSAGMGLRLGFSVIAHLNPKVLLVDEVLAVGDMYFQRKCLERIREYKQKGTSIVLVSHNLWVVQSRCDRVIYVSDGGIRFDGDPAEAVKRYAQDSKRIAPTGSTACGRESEDRCGSYEAEIIKVGILGASGLEKEEFSLGEKLTVSLDYHAKRKIKNPSFGVALFDAEGSYVHGASTLLDGFPIKEIEGTGRIDFTIDRLTLYSGPYYLTVAISDREGIYYDNHIKKYNFRVKNPGTEHGMFHIFHHWESVAGDP